ncbi:hypothetical protein [Streptomyces ureilyticus]|uniref:UTRA domain-containing protein n=1 Tax=Streptomyces ureilyticus TaxID=1775131 RepID=A0ABX0E6H5_9ACTN|nr:hypothetical protein [Streptomyces ureilyticus]NGO48989.1 hypothetical protein [Streptomyces ureilyticus]
MDEAFIPLHALVLAMLPAIDEYVDDEAGVRAYITRYHIESPIELDVTTDAEGAQRIGTTPPLYYVDTSLRPSYHQMRFTVERGAGDD